MVRLMPIQAGNRSCPLPLAIALFVSVSALIALCAKQARRVSRKNEARHDSKIATNDSKMVPKLSLLSPKHLLPTFSNKAIPFIQQRRSEAEPEAIGGKAEEEGFGVGGLWQKAILMGEKCQPPEFSGVIQYDCYGNSISELPPRSPRSSPLPSFAFPVSEVSS